MLSCLICLPPVIGWNDWPVDWNDETPCELSQNKGYVIYSAMGSFYIPLAIIMFVYFKIFQVCKISLKFYPIFSNWSFPQNEHIKFGFLLTKKIRPLGTSFIFTKESNVAKWFFDICNAEIAQRRWKSWNLDIQSEFSMSKIIWIFLNFCFHWRISF